MNPHLRALLIALHLVAITVLAIPEPGAALQRMEQRDDPAVRAWAELLPGSTGANVGRIRDLGSAWGAGLDAARSLPERYEWAVGARQQWTMFGRVREGVSRVELDARRAGTWTPLFRPQDPDHHWGSWTLDDERVRTLRSTIAATGQERRMQVLASWALTRLHAEDPAVDAVRLRVRRGRLARPDARAPTDLDAGRVVHEWVEEAR